MNLPVTSIDSPISLSVHYFDENKYYRNIPFSESHVRISRYGIALSKTCKQTDNTYIVFKHLTHKNSLISDWIFKYLSDPLNFL